MLNLNVTNSIQHYNNIQHFKHHTAYVKNLESQNVLQVNEPVLIVRSDDAPIGPKHVALYVLLMVIIDVLDGNINALYKIWNTSGQIKLRSFIAAPIVSSVIPHHCSEDQ